MAKKFGSAAAFKSALEARLRERARDQGVPVSTLQLKFVIERGALDPGQIRSALQATFATRGTHPLVETLAPPLSPGQRTFLGWPPRRGSRRRITWKPSPSSAASGLRWRLPTLSAEGKLPPPTLGRNRNGRWGRLPGVKHNFFEIEKGSCHPALPLDTINPQCRYTSLGPSPGPVSRPVLLQIL